MEERPGVLLVGAAGVGKRTLLSRLLSTEIPDAHDLSSGVLCQGWTVETKYYSADLSVWTAHLGEGFSLDSLPHLNQLAALVMVFDMSDESSFLTLQNWVANSDIRRFEILLCIGNKADLVPGHGAHVEYRRRMQRLGESNSDPHPEYFDFGINDSEGCGLLSEEEPCIEIRDSSSQWCSEHNIEYIEACASSVDFDKCLSVDGDSQGVDRLFGAISAYMCPGMILKSGNRITNPSLVEKKNPQMMNPIMNLSMRCYPMDLMDHGNSLKIANDDAGPSVSNFVPIDGSTETAMGKPETQNQTTEDNDQGRDNNTIDQTEKTRAVASDEHQADPTEVTEQFEDEVYGLDDLERLMSEMGNIRSNLRLMPDFQRREMAARLAMKMAVMFGDSDEEGFEAVQDN